MGYVIKIAEGATMATVLVIDDDTYVRRAFRLFLEEMDHSVIEAESGVAGMICRRPPFGLTRVPKVAPRPPKQVVPPVPPTVIKAAVAVVGRRNPFQPAVYGRTQ